MITTNTNENNMSSCCSRAFLCVSVLLCCVLASGCGENVNDTSRVIVSVGDKDITVGDFNERLSNLPPRYRAVVSRRKREFLEELINDTLLYQEAIRQGLDKDDDVRKVIEQAREKILISRLLQDRVDGTIEVTEEEIKDFYDKNGDLYMTPEIMRVSHILLTSREDAEKVREELARGAVFEDLARTRSVDPTAQRGGDVGYFPKGQLMPSFEAACASLEPGEVSDVVRTQLGYHVIKLTDRRSPELRPLEQVRGDIHSKIRAAKRQKKFNVLLKELRDDSGLEVDIKALGQAGAIREEKPGGSNAQDITGKQINGESK